MTTFSHNTPFTPIPLTTLLTDQPPSEPILPGLLPQGLTLLLGQPCAGKSWLALHIALSTALSQSVLGHTPIPGAEVLYLGLQHPPSRMASRCHKLLGDAPIPNGFSWTNQCNPVHKDGLASLDTWLTAHPCTRLVVIDSLALLSPSLLRSARTTAQDCALLHQLQDLATCHQLAILLVHSLPTRPSRDPLSELTRIPALSTVDALLFLKRERGQSDATLLITGPDLPEQELALTLQEDSMQWTLLGHAADYRLSQQRQDILAVLREHKGGPLSPKQIASLLRKDPRTVTKLLFDMSHNNQLHLAGRGQYMLASSNISNNPPHQHQSLSFPSDRTTSNIMSEYLLDPTIAPTSNAPIRNIGNISNITHQAPPSPTPDQPVLPDTSISNNGNISNNLPSSLSPDQLAFPNTNTTTTHDQQFYNAQQNNI